MTNNSNDKMQQLILSIIEEDKALREKYQIGDKFRFVRDRLATLQHKIEENLAVSAQKEEKKTDVLAEDEQLVYVYIFNSQGLSASTWQKMLHPSVFYEYSVNRPVYHDKAHVESFIRSKPSKVQHGYLTIAIKKSDVLSTEATHGKDNLGHPLLKIREGSLDFNRLHSFRYNDEDYAVKPDGQMVKKEKA